MTLGDRDRSAGSGYTVSRQSPASSSWSPCRSMISLLLRTIRLYVEWLVKVQKLISLTVYSYRTASTRACVCLTPSATTTGSEIHTCSSSSTRRTSSSPSSQPPPSPSPSLSTQVPAFLSFFYSFIYSSLHLHSPLIPRQRQFRGMQFIYAL